MVEDIFNKYYARLCIYANSILKDLDASEDVVQSVFENLIYREDDVLFDNGNPLPYLYRSVRNSSLKIIRKNNYHSTYLAEEPINIIENSFDEKIIRSELIAILVQYIDELPDGCSKVLKMIYIDGYKNAEVAKILNISIHTVKSQRSRGVKLLKDRLSLQKFMFLIFLIKFL